MGYGIKQKAKYVRGGIFYLTNTVTTKTWKQIFIENGVPLTVTKLYVFVVGGGGGEGGGHYYESNPESVVSFSDTEYGGGEGGSGRVNDGVIDIVLDEIPEIKIGSAGYNGQDEIRSNGHTIQYMVSGTSGNATSVKTSAKTISAGGGDAGGNSTESRTGNGGNGGSGGTSGFGEKYQEHYKGSTSTDYWVRVQNGKGGSNGGGATAPEYWADPNYPMRPSISQGSVGSGGGKSTRPFGLAQYECAKGGSNSSDAPHSAMGFGDGGYTQNQPRNGVAFFQYKDGGK